MSRGGGGGVEKALVPIYDENNCVTGWAIQVVGEFGLPCIECSTGEDAGATVTGSLHVTGEISGYSLNFTNFSIEHSGQFNTNGGINAQGQIFTPVSLTAGNSSINSDGVLRLQSSVSQTGFGVQFNDAVDATAVELLSSGMVPLSVRIDALVSNGTAATFLSFSLTMGGTTTQNIITGPDTFQYRLNVDGSVDLRRTAGTGLGKATTRLMWI